MLDYKTALEISARIWCDKEYSSYVMNPKLAEHIAGLLLQEAEMQDAQKTEEKE